MGATVIEIQVGSSKIVHSLKEACEEYLKILKATEFSLPAKIHFLVKLPSGVEKTITIREEDTGVVAYGSFEGLPSFLDYAKEVEGV